MGMRSFITAGRLDNAIQGDEFGNDELSHIVFFIKLGIFAWSDQV
jgi:hypothetical protein